MLQSGLWWDFSMFLLSRLQPRACFACSGHSPGERARKWRFISYNKDALKQRLKVVALFYSTSKSFYYYLLPNLH